MAKLGRILLGWCVIAGVAQGAVLPSGLTPDDINAVVNQLGFGSTSKMLRSAEAYPFFPGLRLGLEICLVPSSGLDGRGNGNGTLPSVIPIPRLHLVKGLMEGGELSFSIFPAQLENTLGTYGGTLKWELQDEAESWMSIAAFGGYTYASGFRDTFASNTFELGFLASKDFVRLKPYVGLSGMTSHGGVAPELAAGTTESSRLWAIHTFLGLEVELPANLAFQIDLFNLDPAASLSVSAKF